MGFKTICPGRGGPADLGCLIPSNPNTHLPALYVWSSASYSRASSIPAAPGADWSVTLRLTEVWDLIRNLSLIKEKDFLFITKYCDFNTLKIFLYALFQLVK